MEKGKKKTTKNCLPKLAARESVVSTLANVLGFISSVDAEFPFTNGEIRLKKIFIDNCRWLSSAVTRSQYSIYLYRQSMMVKQS